ncbi:MAG TPA: hypothetical protein VFZ59_05720 [Verrucomicrobiae bacterium]|nr:hypothetical protein [Verrucomicrobiae bacterium]
MKSRLSHIILATVLTALGTFTSTSQTNRPAGLILPPADSDARTHILASLLTTNEPGEYSLPRVWVGAEKVTVEIGSFRTKEGGPTNQWLKFDQLMVGRQSLHPKQREDRFIISRREKNRGENPIGASFYRASLPSDSELMGMRDFQSVSNLFGWNPFAHATNLIGANSQWVSIRYFALGPSDTIETVQVTFMKRGNESQIDNIRVSRSRLHPEPKAEQ